jgi:hypothetical protein
MSALPADQEQESPLDPERILRVLPDRERETFLAQYRRAVDGARARALAGTGEGMLLDDALRHFRPGG